MENYPLATVTSGFNPLSLPPVMNDGHSGGQPKSVSADFLITKRQDPLVKNPIY